MKTATINIKQIPKMEFRFDPSLHLSEGVKVREKLADLPLQLKSLSQVTDNIFLGNIFSRIWVKDTVHGIPYLSASDTVLANLETGQFLAKRQGIEMPYLLLKKGWILITCSGSLGNTAYTNKNFEGKIATHDLIRVIPNDDKIPSGYLYAFISSKYGYYQITQSQFGGVVKHINANQAGQIMIPEFPVEFQEKIDGMIKESARLREEATDELNKAVNYFDSLYQIKKDFTKIFKRNIKDIRNNFASFNNNLEVEEFISTYLSNSISINELTDLVFAPPLFKHIYLDKDNGHPFMTGSELTQFNLRYYRWLSPRGVKDINDYKIKEGTLLLYKSGTTDGGILGNVFIADKKLDGCCLSDHVIRMVFKDKRIAYWAFAFLRSKGSVKMLQSLATGTMIPFITPERLKEVRIPIPDDNFKQVVDSVEKYINWNSKSKELELEAISLVESEIEIWTKE